MVFCIDPKCDQQFPSIKELAFHVEDRRAHGDGHLCCVECTLTFDNVKQRVRHNTQVSTFTCLAKIGWRKKLTLDTVASEGAVRSLSGL